jgi:predicted nuclease of restriction endonuclease-like RecB superfamily
MPRKKLPKTRNKFEARIDQQLRSAGTRYTYESEKIPYVIAGHYTPDFVIQTKTGKVYLETKGYFRPEHKRKMKAVKQMHPELDIRIIFYSHSRPNIRWAEKHGFKYAFHSIPEDWFAGF